MKEIPLTHGLVAQVSDQDYQQLSVRRWVAYRVAGTGRGGKVYLYGYKVGYRTGARVKTWMHNVIMNPPPGFEVDHIDGNPLNNQRDNLRVVTHAENCRNRARNPSSRSQFRGVSWNTKSRCWRVAVGGKSFGQHACELDAATVWNLAVGHLRPNNTKWNEVAQPWLDEFLAS